MTEERKKEIYHFKKFLLKNKIYSKFIKDIENPKNEFKNIYHFYSLKEFLKDKRENEWIDYAFDWSHSPQGDRFWNDISLKWHRNITNRKYNIHEN